MASPTTTAQAPAPAASRAGALAGRLQTTIGSKLIVAVTGLALLAFVLVHLWGNLKVFQGREAINAYSHALTTTPYVWVARAGLLAVFVLHVVTAARLARRSRAARPVRYARPTRPQLSTPASRTMLLSGLTLLAFVVYHLLHFTFGAIQADSHGLVDAQGRHDVYAMVVLGFQSPVVVASYVVAMLLLGLHLAHGACSVWRTLGFVRPSYEGALQKGSIAVVALVVLGNCAIPLLILLGAVPVPGGGS